MTKGDFLFITFLLSIMIMPLLVWIRYKLTRRIEVFQQGKHAAKVGIPSNANPYQGQSNLAEMWLKGYIEEIEKLEQ